jgi:predicted porin
VVDQRRDAVRSSRAAPRLRPQQGKVDGFDSQKVDQFKATLQYNVSKRTALYTTGSWLTNKDDTRLTLPALRA